MGSGTLGVSKVRPRVVSREQKPSNPFSFRADSSAGGAGRLDAACRDQSAWLCMPLIAAAAPRVFPELPVRCGQSNCGAHSLRISSARIIAKLLKTSPEEKRSRTYKLNTFEHSLSKTIEFFGVQIRTQYRNAGRGRRRVSPRALIRSAHHRAIWEITPISFDPETMEVLLSECPVCKHALGWSRLQGVTKCDRCRDVDGRSVDLRDYASVQSVLEPHDPEALQFVVGLIHPIEDNKRKARSLIREP